MSNTQIAPESVDRTPASVTFAGDTLIIDGSVHFGNANSIYEQGVSALKGLKTEMITFDLAGLSQSHTVLLAVIVQWIRRLNAGQRLHLVNVPAKMQSIIQTSRLQEIL
ncbi:STAS domain-containing protein [Aquirhabdus parva]|uniref:STAS domain-containing protein n=1 Tax=Aquirhabdus parva TaxID=2283318 RepID=A0A345P8H6_9GAMM|nr:STAS domain-containing protein [Aquirhabdus parva]AXI03585.1 hypothetical protein HYN46_12535 [Aquirhabdus parva]